MLDLTMKDGVNFSKKVFERLNQEQKKSVLEIMGGKTWLIKDGCLLVISYNVTLNKFELIPWKFSRESAYFFSKETEKALYKISEKLKKIK